MIEDMKTVNLTQKSLEEHTASSAIQVAAIFSSHCDPNLSYSLLADGSTIFVAGGSWVDLKVFRATP